MRVTLLAILGVLLGGSAAPGRAQAPKPDSATLAEDRHSRAARRAHRRLRRPADREDAGLHRRRRLAAEAAQQLDHRPGRRPLCRARRSHLDLPAAAHADQRRSGADRCHRQGARTESPSTCMGFPRPYGVLGDCCRAGAVGHGVRCGRQAAARVGRPGRSRQVQGGGRLRLAGQRARHLRRPQRLRLSRRQQRQPRSERLGLGVEQRRRRHDPEVHQGRQVRDDDRRPRREGPGQQQQGRRQQRHAAVLSAGRHHGRSGHQPHVCVGRLRQSPRGHRRRRDRASTSGISAPTATTRSTTRPPPLPASG